MKLKILVPHCGEPESAIRKLLDSIADQIQAHAHEVSVVIVDNGVNSILSRKITTRYPFKIEHFILPDKHDPLYVKDSCIERAEADYVMFCDARDFLMGTSGISYILQCIDRYHFDVFSSKYYERRINEDGDSVYRLCEDNPETNCGKVYRLSFLKAHNITWQTEKENFNIKCWRLSEIHARDYYAFYVSVKGA